MKEIEPNASKVSVQPNAPIVIDRDRQNPNHAVYLLGTPPIAEKLQDRYSIWVFPIDLPQRRSFRKIKVDFKQISQNVLTAPMKIIVTPEQIQRYARTEWSGYREIHEVNPIRLAEMDPRFIESQFNQSLLPYIARIEALQQALKNMQSSAVQALEHYRNLSNLELGQEEMNKMSAVYELLLKISNQANMKQDLKNNTGGTQVQ